MNAHAGKEGHQRSCGACGETAGKAAVGGWKHGCPGVDRFAVVPQVSELHDEVLRAGVGKRRIKVKSVPPRRAVSPVDRQGVNLEYGYRFTTAVIGIEAGRKRGYAGFTQQEFNIAENPCGLGRMGGKKLDPVYQKRLKKFVLKYQHLVPSSGISSRTAEGAIGGSGPPGADFNVAGICSERCEKDGNNQEKTHIPSRLAL